MSDDGERAATHRKDAPRLSETGRTPEQIENDQRTRAAWYQRNKKKQRRVQKARQLKLNGLYRQEQSTKFFAF
jgi:hypothetical protein